MNYVCGYKENLQELDRYNKRRFFPKSPLHSGCRLL